MEHGEISKETLCSRALPHSKQRHSPVPHPPAAEQILVLRKQQAAVPKPLLCLSLKELPVPTPSFPGCCSCRKAASSQHCPTGSSYCCFPVSTARRQGTALLWWPQSALSSKELLPCFSLDTRGYKKAPSCLALQCVKGCLEML